eukprot:744366-Ditylum_brightwellii.AAC.1
MKYKIRNGPEELGGVDFFFLAHVQGTAQITIFLNHWRTDSITSNLLRIALVWGQYQVGTGNSILEIIQHKLPHLEVCWIPSLCQYLQLINGSIEVDKAYIQSLQRENDNYTMDIILELYLQATTIADLTLADSTMLDSQFLSGQHSLLSSETKYIEINQACPSKNDWRLWSKANKIWSSQGILKQPLGKWLVSGPKLRQSWPMYYDQTNDTLMVKMAVGYTQYLKMINKSLSFVDGHSIQWEISKETLP